MGVEVLVLVQVIVVVCVMVLVEVLVGVAVEPGAPGLDGVDLSPQPAIKAAGSNVTMINQPISFFTFASPENIFLIPIRRWNQTLTRARNMPRERPGKARRKLPQPQETNFSSHRRKIKTPFAKKTIKLIGPGPHIDSPRRQQRPSGLLQFGAQKRGRVFPALALIGLGSLNLTEWVW